ncbi:MAG: hypothetical protein JWO57_25 [Pseudonocardiales bacterium]|nr:hypothetical protein [Pseudonocardiales bacterium]
MWIAVIAWSAAVVVAAVVLGFCAYELHWKARRLQSDLRRLLELNARLGGLQGEVAAAQERLARAGVR